MDVQAKLNTVIGKIKRAENLAEVLPLVSDAILAMLKVRGFLIFERQSSGEAVGQVFGSDVIFSETRMPLSTHSIPGIVALSQKPLAITDVRDGDALRKIHQNLTFTPAEDAIKVKSIMAIPIKPGAVPLGIFIAYNKRGEAFSKTDLAICQHLGKAIGEKFHVELQATSEPFGHLIQMGDISKEKLAKYESAASQSGVSLARTLVEKGGIALEDVAISLERYYMVPFMEYYEGATIPKELADAVKDTYMRSNCWAPVSGDKDKAFILIDDPTDMHRLMEIESLLGASRYAFMVGLPEDIMKFIDHAPRVDNAASETTSPENTGETGNDIDARILKKKKKKPGEEDVDADVIKLVDRILSVAHKTGGSDIHIQTREGSPTAVRVRVDGATREVMTFPPEQSRAVAARIKIMSKLDIAERRLPQDGKFFTKIDGNPTELRVATVPTVQGENVAMRILASSEPLPLEKLNMSSRNLKELINLSATPHGILLVVGPTGSGKTTTLHAVLGHINTPERVIWTAEDPVEITQKGLNQVQMHAKIGLTFASALRSFLRADPDVIMIGEMRDQETAQIGVEASLTGHLVLSTLHTNSAPETITRLLDLGLDPINFSDALLGVLAQRLIRTLCVKCKQSYDATDDEYRMLIRYYGEENFGELGVKKGNLKLFIPTGCDVCGGTGYKGRTGIHELLVATPEISEMIYKGSTAAEIKEKAKEQGMRTLLQDGIVKIIKGQSDISQLRKVTG